MSTNTEQKTGALHLRLMDNEEQYSDMLAYLLYYNKDNEHYTTDVLGALEDGLENYNRFQKLDNALSPRFIKIEKRIMDKGEKLKANDTEGAYHIRFHFDNEKEEVIHFKRKQEQLLYMLILLSSLKNGYTAEFLRKPVKEDYLDDDGDLYKRAFERANNRYNLMMVTARQLMEMVYPAGGTKDSIIREMDPEVSFTDIIQNMRSVIGSVIKKNGELQEERWFMPYTLNVNKKRIYQMHMEPTKIIYPEELQPIVDAMPQANDYVDMSSYVSEEMQKEDNEILLKGVQMGNVKSMNLLAQAYNEGIGRVADQDKAFALWKKTSEIGDAEGLFYVGAFYGTGDVVSQDYSKSIQYLQKASELGYADALYQLGVYRLHGFGCDIDWNEALNYYRAAAEKGCAEAAYSAGYIYDRGEHGVKKDDKKAFNWFLKAAELNHTLAIRYVIRAYRDGLVEDEEGEEYLYWIEKGLELDIPEVYLQVGVYMYQDEDYEMAFELLETASDEGLTVANHILAQMLIKGQGVEKDIERGIDYLREGAYNNDETCLMLLKKVRPEQWKEITSELEDVLDMRTTLQTLVGEMTPQANQNYFLQLVDSYREHFHEDYQKEINKQLSIHRSSTDKKSRSKRKIIVRKSSSKKARYEIVIILANGEEMLVKLNPNSLVLLLLTIICSFKSGYSTVMALDKTCRSVMAELVRLVLGYRSEAKATDYVWKYMDSSRNGTNFYKQYSNDAKKSIDRAISEYDDAIHFLFDNNETIGKRPLRSMNLDAKDIELPPELLRLAQQMPDGKEILYSLEDE